MSLPRPILAGASYLVTRRCTQRQFLLLPNRVTTQVFLYCLALAQRDTGVKVHAVVVMSNHYHVAATDPDGKIPEFLEILNKYVAKCMNTHYGRIENFWAAGVQTSLVRLGDDDALLDKAVYTITNPVASHLVKRHREWPGLLLWQPGTYKARRPRWFFRENGVMPAELALEIEPLPFSDTSDRVAATERLRAAVAARESEIHARARAEGRRFGSTRDLRTLKHTDSPLSEETRRAMSPRVASRDKWRRIELLQRLGTFVAEYRAALRRWLDGDRLVVFPAGCYRLKRDFNVCCADA